MTRRRAPGATTRDGYGYAHQRARARLLEGAPACHRCGAPATTADHVPPLDLVARTLGLTRADAAALYSTDPTSPYRLLPACGPCNFDAGARYLRARRAAGIPAARAAAPARLNVSRSW